jgi:hypothetical protein
VEFQLIGNGLGTKIGTRGVTYYNKEVKMGIFSSLTVGCGAAGFLVLLLLPSAARSRPNGGREVGQTSVTLFVIAIIFAILWVII